MSREAKNVLIILYEFVQGICAGLSLFVFAWLVLFSIGSQP